VSTTRGGPSRRRDEHAVRLVDALLDRRLASSLSGSNGFPSVLYLPAEISVVFTPSFSCIALMSSWAANTPIDPTSPDGVTTSSSACDASQYAADAASVFATATIGFFAARATDLGGELGIRSTLAAGASRRRSGSRHAGRRRARPGTSPGTAGRRAAAHVAEQVGARRDDAVDRDDGDRPAIWSRPLAGPADPRLDLLVGEPLARRAERDISDDRRERGRAGSPTASRRTPGRRAGTAVAGGCCHRSCRSLPGIRFSRSIADDLVGDLVARARRLPLPFPFARRAGTRRCPASAGTSTFSGRRNMSSRAVVDLEPHRRALLHHRPAAADRHVMPLRLPVQILLQHPHLRQVEAEPPRERVSLEVGQQLNRISSAMIRCIGMIPASYAASRASPMFVNVDRSRPAPSPRRSPGSRARP
jgi:hypothetical protein